MSLYRSASLIVIVMLCVTPAVLLMGCSAGDQGPQGTDGTDGNDGAPGLGIVPVQVLDVHGNPVSANVTVKAHVKSYGSPPVYVAAAQVVAPAAVGDFELHLPPGTYDIWAQITINGFVFRDANQGVYLNYVVDSYGNNDAIALRVSTSAGAVGFAFYDSNGGGLNNAADHAWWRFNDVDAPTAVQTWIWSTMSVASGTPSVSMVNGWLQADGTTFGTQGVAFNYAVNTDRGTFAMGSKLPARVGSDDANNVNVRIDGINGQPAVTPTMAGLWLVQTGGTLAAGGLY